MKKLAYVLYITMFFSSCMTINHTTVPTFSDYQLCDFLTLNWITTSGERMAIISELSKRKLACNGGVPIPDKGGIRTAELPHPTAPQPSVKQQVVAGGTGFLFGSKDYAITNWHVVKGANSIVAKFTDGQTVKAVVVAKDLKNDIAILKLENASPFAATPIKLGDSSSARMGEKIFTIGYPASKIMGEKPKYSEGVINAVTGAMDDPTFFQVSVPIQPGNSGGPLFNERGEVIGITTASLSPLASDAMGAMPQNVNYAIKSSFVKNLLSTIPDLMLSNTNIVVVPKDSENSLPNFIEQVSKNIVIIEAKK
jgi:S1-C subfamily serine protease